MYEILYMDCCLPDYFSGSHLPVISFPVDGKTSLTDILNELRNPFNSEHIEELDWDNYLKAVKLIELFHKEQNTDFSAHMFPMLEIKEFENNEDFQDLDDYDNFSQIYFVLKQGG